MYSQIRLLVASANLDGVWSRVVNFPRRSSGVALGGQARARRLGCPRAANTPSSVSCIDGPQRTAAGNLTTIRSLSHSQRRERFPAHPERSRRAPSYSLFSALLAALGGVGLTSSCLTERESHGAPELSADAPRPSATNGPDTVNHSQHETSSASPEPATSEPGASGAPEADASQVRRRVNGTIIDFWGHPVPNVRLALAGAETTSNAEGAFAFADVPELYDISLSVRIAGDSTEVYGYRFVGLTRRDPLLQIFKGLPQRTAPLQISVTGVEGQEGLVGEIALGGQHGQRSYALSANAAESAGWRGPSTHESPIRFLLWETSPDDRRIPGTFLSYQRSTLSLTDAVPAYLDVAVSGPLAPLPAIRINTTTERAPGESHIASSYLRFEAGPAIGLSQLPRSSSDNGPFETVAPMLDDASVTVAAISGNGTNESPFSVVYANRLDAATSATLVFGETSELLAPADQANSVGKEDEFTWTDTGDTYIVAFEDLEVYQTVYVITAQPKTSIPDLESLGIYYPHGGTYRWSVESHGPARSVDELCSPPGYLDPFSADFNYPMGPRLGAGRFWRTAGRLFTFQ